MSEILIDLPALQQEIADLKDELQEKAERLAESFLSVADKTRELIKGDGAKEMAWIAVLEDPRYQDVLQQESAVQDLIKLWREGKR